MFIRGATRDTTLRIVQEIISLSIDKSSKLSIVATLATKLNKNDVVIHDDLGWNALLLTFFQPFIGYQVVIRLRGDAFRVLEKGPYVATYLPRRLLTSLILRRAHFILFNSKNIRSDAQYRFAVGRSGVAYNPLMCEGVARDTTMLHRQRETDQPFRIVTPINFHFIEKIAPLTRALNDWLDPKFLRDENIEWDILGNGYYFEDFCRDVNIDRFGDQLRLHGHVDNVLSFYAKSHVCAYLSGFDAFPNVALEAAYFELPIVTTAESGGTLEAMVDGKSGRIVSDAESFRKAILTYRDDPSLRVGHGRAGRDHVLARFTIDKQRAVATRILRSHFEGQRDKVSA